MFNRRTLETGRPRGFSKSARYFLVGDDCLCCEINSMGGALAKPGRDYRMGDGYVYTDKPHPLSVYLISNGVRQLLGEVKPGDMLRDPRIKFGSKEIEVSLLGANVIDLPLDTPLWRMEEEANKVTRAMVVARRKKRADAKKARAE